MKPLNHVGSKVRLDGLMGSSLRNHYVVIAKGSRHLVQILVRRRSESFFAFWRSKTQKSQFWAQNEKIVKFQFFAFWRSERTDRQTHTQRTETSVAPPFSRLWNEARGRGSAPPHSNIHIFIEFLYRIVCPDAQIPCGGGGGFI